MISCAGFRKVERVNEFLLTLIAHSLACYTGVLYDAWNDNASMKLHGKLLTEYSLGYIGILRGILRRRVKSDS
jgi:hypothetical protein